MCIVSITASCFQNSNVSKQHLSDCTPRLDLGTNSNGLSLRNIEQGYRCTENLKGCLRMQYLFSFEKTNVAIVHIHWRKFAVQKEYSTHLYYVIHKTNMFSINTNIRLILPGTIGQGPSRYVFITLLKLKWSPSA